MQSRRRVRVWGFVVLVVVFDASMAPPDLNEVFSTELGTRLHQRCWRLALFWRGLSAENSLVFTVSCSNGDLDPWSGGGVTTLPRTARLVFQSFEYNLTSGGIAILYVRAAAHHLDIRSANAGDTQEVRGARNVERCFLRKWISQSSHPFECGSPVVGSASRLFVSGRRNLCVILLPLILLSAILLAVSKTHSK